MRSEVVPKDSAPAQSITRQPVRLINPLQYVRIARGWPAVTFGLAAGMVLCLFAMAAFCQGDKGLAAILAGIIAADSMFVWRAYRGIEETE